MRFLTFEKDGVATLGVRKGPNVVDLARASRAAPSSMMEVLNHAFSLQQIQKIVDTAEAGVLLPFRDLKFLPPIPRPGKIVCVGLNYADHRREAGMADKPSFPGMFHKMPSSLVGHHAPIMRPKVSEQLDFEAELAIVIGRRCHRVTVDEALSYVFGYTILNDGSIRDYQIEKALAAGKNFDATGGCGPEIVTADELPLGASGLRIETRLNGQIMQLSNTEHMTFSVAEIIALLSDIHTLEPGDIVSTGTCAGVGGARKPPVWLKPGDRLEMEIARIGVLANPIVDEE